MGRTALAFGAPGELGVRRRAGRFNSRFESRERNHGDPRFVRRLPSALGDVSHGLPRPGREPGWALDGHARGLGLQRGRGKKSEPMNGAVPPGESKKGPKSGRWPDPGPV